MSRYFITAIICLSFQFYNVSYSQTTSTDVVFLNQSSEETDAPIRLAVDKNNNIFITDDVKKCIIKYDATGNFVKKIYTEGIPVSIAFNSKDELFVGEKSGRIIKIGTDETQTVFNSNCGFPTSMDFSPNDFLYITDSKNMQVIVLDGKGDIFQTFGSEIFTFPSSIKYDSKNERILVGEHGGIGGDFSIPCKVWIFDNFGNQTGSFGSYGGSDGKFYRIQGIEIGKCGNIYVCEPFQGNISVFDENGIFITKFAEFGTAPGQLAAPLDIKFDSQERIIIPSLNNGNINFYSVSSVLPTSYIYNSDATICSGETTDINVKFTGTAPWTFTYTVNGLNPITLTTSENPYTFSVTNGGIYEITNLTDGIASGTCFSGSADITVHSELPTASIFSENITICNSEVAEIQVSLTGIAPWTFTYTNNGINPKTITTYDNNYFITTQEAGTYELTSVSGGACIGNEYTGSVNVNVNTAPSASFDIGNKKVEICSGDETNLSVSFTGTSPWNIIYTIDDKNPVTVENIIVPNYNITATEAGTYEIISVSDSICNTGFSLGYPEIAVNSRPTVTFENTFSNICLGESTSIPVFFTGEAPWSITYTTNTGTATLSNIYTNPNVLTVTQGGNYDVISITDANCYGNEYFGDAMITVLPAAIPDFNYISNELTVTFLNNSTDANSYLWDFGDGSTSTDINPTHTYLNSGTYQVTLTASNQLCGDETITKSVNVTLVSVENRDNNNFEIYPNPTNGLVSIILNNNSDKQTLIEIYNINGQKVFSQSASNKILQKLNLNNFSNGIYFVKVITGNFSQTKRLVLNK